MWPSNKVALCVLVWRDTYVHVRARARAADVNWVRSFDTSSHLKTTLCHTTSNSPQVCPSALVDACLIQLTTPLHKHLSPPTPLNLPLSIQPQTPNAGDTSSSFYRQLLPAVYPSSQVSGRPRLSLVKQNSKARAARFAVFASKASKPPLPAVGT